MTLREAENHPEFEKVTITLEILQHILKVSGLSTNAILNVCSGLLGAVIWGASGKDMDESEDLLEQSVTLIKANLVVAEEEDEPQQEHQ